MEHSTTNFPESIKMQFACGYSVFLDNNEINRIYERYTNFSNQEEIKTEKIAGLMYFLYAHENVEFYLEEFGLNKDAFLKCYKVSEKLFTGMKFEDQEYE